MKRKATESQVPTLTKDSTPKKRRTAAPAREEPSSPSEDVSAVTPSRSKSKKNITANGINLQDEVGSVTPKTGGKSLFATPTKASKLSTTTPSRTKRADQSAKRKSTRVLQEQEDDEDWNGEAALAQEILQDDQGADGDVVETVEELAESEKAQDGTLAETPSKRGRGRPKGAKNKRSPTPEGDIPPEERYFYQNRSGPPQVSNNTLASLKLLKHDEYFALVDKHKDPHTPEKAYLLRLHTRSFPQWHFEFNEGFNICLHGWGSKRQLMTKFAEYIHSKMKPAPTILIVNGYVPKTTIRSILLLMAETVMGDALPSRFSTQPTEMIDAIFSYLAQHPRSSPIFLLVNSIDAPPLRRHTTQSLLARLASHPRIHLLATTDTPIAPLLWDSSLRSQLKLVFHDCTTYASYDAERNVVDDVHELLGRKGHRIGGKEGVGFVLKSLPENARNLYRVLLTEILTVLADGMPMYDDDDEDGYGSDQSDTERTTTRSRRKKAAGGGADGEIGIPYRTLYEKASEEFICSSEMSFRTLLKEFHDHQMIVSRKDGAGTEVLGVPLSKEDCEGVLEDLVLSG